ncbi:MAG: hypothetical protein NTV48_00795 [Candidatus Vogelbacteria bacterium]|nr:hypothetical protein [Candidatus Vogelbacteria bacterium]
MIKFNNKGTANGDAIWFLGIMAILFFAWIGTGGPQKAKNAKPFLEAPTNSPKVLISTRDNYTERSSSRTSDELAVAKNTTKKDPTESIYHDQVSLGWGNAMSQTNATYEYITLNARSDNKLPIVISGWRLENGGAKRLYDQGGNVIRGQNIVNYIPYGVDLWRSNNATPLGFITLKPGDRAYVITGNSINTSYLPKQSFRINKCMGYLENLPGYHFYPSISTNCPDPSKEPGMENFGDVCEKYIDRISRCHTPVVGWDKDNGETLDRRYDLPSYCKTFAQQRFNYATCAAEYAKDKDFYQPEWRIYLGRVWEMYYKEKEMVTLYDSRGKIVDQLKSY